MNVTSIYGHMYTRIITIIHVIISFVNDTTTCLLRFRIDFFYSFMVATVPNSKQFLRILSSGHSIHFDSDWKLVPSLVIKLLATMTFEYEKG